MSIFYGLPVRVGPKYLAGLDPAPHDVMQGPRGIQPRLSGHIALGNAFRSSCHLFGPVKNREVNHLAVQGQGKAGDLPGVQIKFFQFEKIL